MQLSRQCPAASAVRIFDNSCDLLSLISIVVPFTAAVLEQLLTVEGIKNLPTVHALLQAPFFQGIAQIADKCSFKVWRF